MKVHVTHNVTNRFNNLTIMLELSCVWLNFQVLRCNRIGT